MAFDVESLRKAVLTHGRVARVVIAEVRGSSPREVGAAMLVWDGGQSGTIGGGTLEFEAAKTALNQTQPRDLSHYALGPDMGQCCGGSVALLTEVYEAADLKALCGDVIVRAVRDGPRPLTVARILNQARNMGSQPAEQLVDGWMIEPVYRPDQPLWIWGAGHVGRALVDVLSPLPQYDITWIDTGAERFPESIPVGVTQLLAAKPELLVPHAQANAQHLVLTYSHRLDLALCHGLLSHGFQFAGLIGSDTKWARFRSRLKALGHSPENINHITCPIGQKHLGKHPQAIAVGVAAELLQVGLSLENKKELTA
ncbi:MAG: xanthine dehydrogenase accessory protein XdhC [Epibacterium sp.]|nr:xanthine dehydrogenase accessory protein XdhC [Epibacterium sp.]NQX74630.1 xanthine dehydrogenase accessory protein XdhC [Epibacterium sp.]